MHISYYCYSAEASISSAFHSVSPPTLGVGWLVVRGSRPLIHTSAVHSRMRTTTLVTSVQTLARICSLAAPALIVSIAPLLRLVTVLRLLLWCPLRPLLQGEHFMQPWEPCP